MNDPNLKSFVQALPKTETHLHVEGALPYELCARGGRTSILADPDLAGRTIAMPPSPNSSGSCWPMPCPGSYLRRAVSRGGLGDLCRAPGPKCAVRRNQLSPAGRAFHRGAGAGDRRRHPRGGAPGPRGADLHRDGARRLCRASCARSSMIWRTGAGPGRRGFPRRGSPADRAVDRAAV